MRTAADKANSVLLPRGLSISAFNLITILGGLAGRSVDADVHCFIIEHLRVGTRYYQLQVTIGLMSSTVE